MDASTSKRFTVDLFDWFACTTRYMPWKNDRDPYKIWLSEVLLQQTTVAQGLPRYLAFVEAFPTVGDLANASQEQVFKLWEGLGYYNRARRLMAAARQVVDEYGGVFPAEYQLLLGLPGVGPYSAAAIASFAFDLPHAVVDGNVVRVLSRVFGLDAPFDSTAGKKLFAQMAQELLPNDRAADFNQALMNFGALHCKPAKPLCDSCAMNDYCVAFKQNLQKSLPAKSKRPDKTHRFFHYFVLRRAGLVAVSKRRADDIWGGLYEFILFEDNAVLSVEALTNTQLWQILVGSSGQVLSTTKPLRQVLTHRLVHVVVVEVALDVAHEINFSSVGFNEVQWVDDKGLSGLAFPVVLKKWLAKKSSDNLLFESVPDR
jgi:A/G-specific adenine glycosylase